MDELVFGGLAVNPLARLRVGASVTLLGHDGKYRELKGNAAVVLAWVALEGHADRRRLSAVLWPESDAAQARSNLRVLTHRINHRFGSELLIGTERLQLDASQVVFQETSAEVVLTALAAGGAARCELLAEAGLEAPASEPLQAWLEGARQRLKRLQLTRLSEALTEALAMAWHERAAALARACVQIEPLCEHRHRRLMEVLVRAGDRAAALAAYEECKELLKQHLGVLPDLQTRTAQLRILQEQASGSAPRKRLEPVSRELAILRGEARYPLVEREAALSQAQAALAQGQHLVLQGEPGVGKTRLLRHLAAASGSGIEVVALRAAVKHEPYGALAQLLQELQARRKPPIGVPEQVELARLAPLAFATVTPSEAAMSVPRLHAALRHWLMRLHGAGVRVLVFDDVQFADKASQAMVASLLECEPDSSEPSPVLLLSCRSGEIEAVLDDAVTAAQTRHQAQRIELPRLTLAGVQALLAAMELPQQTATHPALAVQLHKRTGGNPLFVIEMARQPWDPSHLPDTANLQALLGRSLKGCSAPAQQLAALAAVAAADFTVALAAAVTGQTALALMPAWTELQQRGLFAGHGLAHDLVQDAVLAGLPQAILQRLHQQVGQYLEDQNMLGASVLRHWLAAQDADRALPHAAHQLYAASAAGLRTTLQELEVLGLLERAGDAVLMNNLWLTAEINSSPHLEDSAAEAWPRLLALRQRVEGLPELGFSAAWIAFETARHCFYMGRSFKDAYAVLAPASERMPLVGLARAHVEYALVTYLFQLTGQAQLHVQRALGALVGLAEQPSVKRVRAKIQQAAAIFLDPAEGIRLLAGRRRAGRRRGDLAWVADADGQIATVHAALGSYARAFRHYQREAQLQSLAQSGDGDDFEQFHSRVSAGVVGLNTGHYAIAQRLLASSDEPIVQQALPVFHALLHLRLGNWALVAQHLARVDPQSLRQRVGTRLVYAHVCAELDSFEGRNPVLGLSQHLEQMRESGLGGAHLELMAWEISVQTQPAPQRLPAGPLVRRQAGQCLAASGRSWRRMRRG
jgi:DNA-binding SARP family transcriptional activator